MRSLMQRQAAESERPLALMPQCKIMARYLPPNERPVTALRLLVSF